MPLCDIVYEKVGIIKTHKTIEHFEKQGGQSFARMRFS